MERIIWHMDALRRCHSVYFLLILKALTFFFLSCQLICKQDQTLLWTCIAGARRCVNSRYAKFKYTGMKSDYIQITQCNLQ